PPWAGPPPQPDHRRRRRVAGPRPFPRLPGDARPGSDPGRWGRGHRPDYLPWLATPPPPRRFPNPARPAGDGRTSRVTGPGRARWPGTAAVWARGSRAQATRGVAVRGGPPPPRPGGEPNRGRRGRGPGRLPAPGRPGAPPAPRKPP